MTILALEFSSPCRSVAVARSGVFLGEECERSASRGTPVFRMVDGLLSRLGVRREEITMVAVGLGPGSYAGIRGAIAVAQGWQLARGTSLMGISSVEALASGAQMQKQTGMMNFIIDAQRGEFYVARWEINEQHRREVQALSVLTAGAVQQRRDQGEVFAGPGEAQILLPQAREIARLAALRTHPQTSTELEPIYLRQNSFVKASKQAP